MKPPAIFGNNPSNKLADDQVRPNLSIHNENQQVKPNLEKLLNEEAPIMRQENYIGIYYNPSQMSLPCRDVRDLMDVYAGSFNSSFNRSDYACMPINPMSALAYVDDRKGFSHDFSQKDKGLVSTYF